MCINIADSFTVDRGVTIDFILKSQKSPKLLGCEGSTLNVTIIRRGYISSPIPVSLTAIGTTNKPLNCKCISI